MNTQELVERLRADADFIDADTYDECWEVKETPRGKTLRAVASRLSEMEAENKRLRALCREAADFYGQGGVFPIDGVMSLRLGGAALEHQQKGKP